MTGSFANGESWRSIASPLTWRMKLASWLIKISIYICTNGFEPLTVQLPPPRLQKIEHSAPSHRFGEDLNDHPSAVQAFSLSRPGVSSPQHLSLWHCGPEISETSPLFLFWFMSSAGTCQLMSCLVEPALWATKQDLCVVTTQHKQTNVNMELLTCTEQTWCSR